MQLVICQSGAFSHVSGQYVVAKLNFIKYKYCNLTFNALRNIDNIIKFKY